MKVEGSVGKAFAEVSFRPEERLHVATYATLLGATDPELFRTDHARDLGYRQGRPIPPPMLGFFLTVSADQLVEELGFTWGKTLNREIDVWSLGIVQEQQEVTGKSFVENAWRTVRPDGSARDYLTLRTDFLVADQLMCRWRVSFTERSSHRQPIEPLEGSEQALEDEFRELSKVADRTSSGASPQPIRVGPFSRVDFARMSAAIANPDPLHVDEEVAREAGFEGVIGQGSTVVGLAHEALRRAFGMTAPSRLQVRQKLPFSIGDSLEARPNDLEVRSDGSLQTQILIVNQNDDEVAEASALIL